MTDPVRIHLRVTGATPMPALMALLESIEAAGFDGAGILDSQMLARDTFVILGQAAARTRRLTLFPAVTNPFTRHASVLASAIQTVEEMAPGRVKFVIGTGYTSASTIGRQPATLAEMRACIRTPKLQVPGAVWKIYPDLSHAHDWEAAIAATSFVPDEVVAQLCDALGLVGTPEYCAERIGEMTKLGARNLYLMPFETFAPPESEIRAFRDVIFPQLRDAGLR